MRNYIQPGNTITLTTPAGGILSGQGLVVGAIFGIASYDAVAGEEVETDVVGVFELPKAAGALTQGQKVYWDATAKNVTGTATSNKLIGVAMLATAADGATVRVRLNGISI